MGNKRLEKGESIEAVASLGLVSLGLVTDVSPISSKKWWAFFIFSRRPQNWWPFPSVNVTTPTLSAFQVLVCPVFFVNSALPQFLDFH